MLRSLNGYRCVSPAGHFEAQELKLTRGIAIPAFHGKGYDSAEQQALHQFSTLFGQQLAGAMQGGGNTSVACSSVGQTTKWGDLGLNITAVEGDLRDMILPKPLN